MTHHALTLTIPARYVFIPHNGKAKRLLNPAEPEPQLRSAVICPFVPTARPWCGQCERLVHPQEARSCNSQWCKAKLALAEQEANR